MTQGKVTSWGTRLVIPAPIIKKAGFVVGDDVLFDVEERNGKKIIIVQKKEE